MSRASIIQKLLAMIFIGLGGWCLLTPHVVEDMVFRPDHQHMSVTTAILIGCFGAQAVLVGLVIFLTAFDARTFLVFGLVASLPFFAFNYYFYFVAEVFTGWMLLDFAGNSGILALCLAGYLDLRSASTGRLHHNDEG